MTEHITYINDLPTRLQRYIDFTANASMDIDLAAGSRIAALILLKNKPVCIGYNSYKTHTLQKKYGKNPQSICVHAEIDAIRKSIYHISPEDLKKSTMIVMRTKKNKTWGLARPCISKNHSSGCQVAIKAFGIKRIIYSGDETGILHIYEP